MQRKVATRTKGQKRSELLPTTPAADPSPGRTPPATRSVANAQEALAVILEPWRKRRHGIRHVVFGDSGTGKSCHFRWLLRAMLDEGVAECALVLDDKDRQPQFVGDYRIDLADADMRPPQSNVVVFRGDWQRGITCDPEELAARCVQFARQQDPLRAVLLIDEVKRATSAKDDGDGKKWTAPSCKVLATEGRSLQSSLLAGNQSPQEAPRSLTDNASTIAIHRLGPIAANYVGSTYLLPNEMVEAIRRLPMGQFVLYIPGQTDWNGIVYGIAPADFEGA